MLEPGFLKALWLPLFLYLVWWVALFVVLTLRLELISPLIEYRKLVYLVGGAIWHLFVLMLVLNRQAYTDLAASLRRQSPLSRPGVLVGLAVVDLGLYYVLTT